MRGSKGGEWDLSLWEEVLESPGSGPQARLAPVGGRLHLSPPVPSVSLRRVDPGLEYLLNVESLSISSSMLSELGTVMGALDRKTDPKISTAAKTQSRSKDQKDEDNSK